MNYRSYNHFSNDRESLISKFSFQRFCDISLATLNKHGPCKIKHVQGNQMPFFNKEISRATMTRIKLRNSFMQNKKEENRKLNMKT